MIYTSNHNCCNYNDKACSISRNRGKDANYTGRCYPLLAPSAPFWRKWRENIGKIPEEENTRFYIEGYYKQILSTLNPLEVYNELDDSILLCYEDNMSFCHRHVVAEWFELTLGVTVSEIQMIDNELKAVTRPKYIRTILEEVMTKQGHLTKNRKSKDMLKIKKGVL